MRFLLLVALVAAADGHVRGIAELSVADNAAAAAPAALEPEELLITSPIVPAKAAAAVAEAEERAAASVKQATKAGKAAAAKAVAKAAAKAAAAAAAAAKDEPGSDEPARVYVVAGATGRTGVLAYKLLQASKSVRVRALVRNQTKAKLLLGCGECGPSDGVFVGDVTNPGSLQAAFDGAHGLVVLTSSVPVKVGPMRYVYPKGATPKDIDWSGALNLVHASLKHGLDHAVLVSSSGTTDPNSFLDKLGNGHALHYKLMAEAALMGSRLPYTIIKPCGLSDAPVPFASQVGHCDKLAHFGVPVIARSAVASIVAAAAEAAPGKASTFLRFDVCSDPLRPKPLAHDDFVDIFKAAASFDDCTA